MPELPEVEALARFLTDKCSGQKIERIEVAALSALKTYTPPVDALRGHTIDGITRRGKYLGLHAGDKSGLVFKGYLGASLFLVLAGFLAVHLVVTQTAQGRFRYGPFLWTRLIRTYPLHLAMIAVMAVLLIGGRLTGAALPAAVFDWRGLLANLALVQGWGTVPTVSWNFPSWLISAEWFAYIALPVTAWIALRRLNPSSAS